MERVGMLAVVVGDGPVGTEETDSRVGTLESDTSDQPKLGGVRVPVVGFMAPAVTDDDKLPPELGRRSFKGAAHRGVKAEGVRGKEGDELDADGVTFIPCVLGILEAEVVKGSGLEQEGDVGAAGFEGAANVEGANAEVVVEVEGVGLDLDLGGIRAEMGPSGAQCCKGWCRQVGRAGVARGRLGLGQGSARGEGGEGW